MKIGVIGASSFLARNLYEYVRRCSVESGVSISDFTLYGRGEKAPRGIDCAYKRVDLKDPNAVSQIDFEADALYIFSGLTGTINSFEHPAMFCEVNEAGLLNVLQEYVKRRAGARIVYPSTRLMYRPSEDPVDELSALEPRSVYAVSKMAAEEYIRVYNRVFGVPYCIMRICATYGSLIPEVDNYGTFSIFEKQAISSGVVTVYGDGKERKTYTHISDVSRLLLKAATEPALANNTFNMGGTALSLGEIAEAIASSQGAKVKNIPWPDLNRAIDGGQTLLDSTKLDAIIAPRYLDPCPKDGNS